MGTIVGFVIHIELTIVKLACGIVITCHTLVGQLIKPIDVLEREAF